RSLVRGSRRWRFWTFGAWLLAVTVFDAAVLAASAAAQSAFAPGASAPAEIPQSAPSVVVKGNRRIEADAVRSYFHPGLGGRLDEAEIDAGLKSLIASGLFRDVRVERSGDRLIVTVVENPVIGRVAFEGNKKVTDDQFKTEVQSKGGG